MNRFAGPLLVVFGCVWGLWYFGMDGIGWGEPGTPAYRRYELYNRLLPGVLLPLAFALLASRSALPVATSRGSNRSVLLACVGLAVMVAGSVLEFWLFTFAPYAPGSLRGLGWGTYCVGLLLLFLGTAWLGIVLRRAPGFRVGAGLLAVWLPGAALLAGANRVTGLALPPLSIAVALCGLGLVLLGIQVSRGRHAD